MKSRVARRNMSICPQAVRVLDNFVEHKRTVSNVKRPNTTLDAHSIRTRSMGDGSPMHRRESQTLDASPSPTKPEDSPEKKATSRPKKEVAQRKDILKGVIPQNKSPIKLKAYDNEVMPLERD